MTSTGRRIETDTKDMLNEEEEVQVYYRVKFRIQTWDGNIKEHEADLPGDVRIGYLKEELKDELGVPTSTLWYIDKSNTLMSDDVCIKDNYNIEFDDVINVVEGHAQSNVPEVTPVMATN